VLYDKLFLRDGWDGAGIHSELGMDLIAEE